MTIDWPAWLARWDAQQEGYVPEREERFTAMLDVLDALLPPAFTALDLASGPGSLSTRLLARFPRARVVAVDMDPVMLALGAGALGTAGDRLHWVEADLESPTWVDALEDTRFDAVLSTTALHWVRPAPLARLYRDLAGLLPAGGLLLNGDHLAYGPGRPTLTRLNARTYDARWSDEAFAEQGLETAEQWWAAFAAEPGTAPLLDARAALLATKERQAAPPDLDAHLAALEAAGFAEVGTVWQRLANRVLLAVR